MTTVDMRVKNVAVRYLSPSTVPKS